MKDCCKICCTDHKEKEQGQKNTEGRSRGERWIRGPIYRISGKHLQSPLCKTRPGEQISVEMNTANPLKENAIYKEEGLD
jgi:hypothetical protein